MLGINYLEERRFDNIALFGTVGLIILKKGGVIMLFCLGLIILKKGGLVLLGTGVLILLGTQCLPLTSMYSIRTEGLIIL